MKNIQVEFGMKIFNKINFIDPLKCVKLDNKTDLAVVEGSIDSDYVKIWEPRSKKV